jgi:hypothetical protein
VVKPTRPAYEIPVECRVLGKVNSLNLLVANAKLGWNVDPLSGRENCLRQDKAMPIAKDFQKKPPAVTRARTMPAHQYVGIEGDSHRRGV